MKRREFITLLGISAVAPSLLGPSDAHAQPAMPTIGFFGTTSPSSWGSYTAAFVQRLHELGWVEGRTIAIEYRWAEGREERYAEIAAELVRLKVDVIVTGGGGVLAAKRATSAIPIVFALASDPLGGGLVASLSRPGGNVTGLSLQAPDIAGKRLELLREVLPNLNRLAVIANVNYSAAALEMDNVQAAARAFALDITKLEIRRTEDIEHAFEALRERADALYICIDPLIGTYLAHIITLALAARLPTMYGGPSFGKAGGLMAYGASYPDLFRRAAEYVDKILRGANPADIPVEQPTKFELVINLKTAKALGLTIPDKLLALADEVIE
jgi:putative ABC transport system substrate-binding protein